MNYLRDCFPDVIVIIIKTFKLEVKYIADELITHKALNYQTRRKGKIFSTRMR